MTRTTPHNVETSAKTTLQAVSVLNFSRTPLKYTENVPKQIYVMATLGLTQTQMADSIGINLSTLQNWMLNRKGCRKAYEEGKYSSDFDVEVALRKKALGYEYEETKHYSGIDSLGRPWSRSVTQTIRVEGDVTAQKYWLANRSSERWRDYSNKGVATNIQVNNINMDIFDEDERKLARSMAIKQLASTNVIDVE